jgi:DNA-binding protein H-NS
LGTYEALKAQLAELEEQVETARAAEIQEVLADIRAKVAVSGFAERDIFGRGRVTHRRPLGGHMHPRYRDPKTRGRRGQAVGVHPAGWRL